MSKFRQSCHNWNSCVEWNVLIGNSFFHHFIFYLFIFCFRRLSKTIESLVNLLWHVCQTWFLRVQMNVFNRNVIFEKKPKRFLAFLIIFDFQGKSCDMWKRFSSRLKKFTLRVQGNDSSGKTFLFDPVPVYFFRLFRTPSGKKIPLAEPGFRQVWWSALYAFR